MKKGIVCSNCGQWVEEVCANCWRCLKCCDCGHKVKRVINGKIGVDKKREY